MNCKLEFLYYLTRPAGSSITFHKHNCYELVYYISGNGTTTIENEEAAYTKNSFSIIHPDIMHDERRHENTDVLFIGFKYNSETVKLRNGLYFDDISKSTLKRLFNIKTEMLEKKSHYNLKLQSLLMDLIIEISRIDSVKVDFKIDFTHIKNFLDENYSQETNCNTLAELSGYSYHRFRHIFKDLYGLSPHNYVIHLRLQNAANMLLATSYTVSHISLDVGFSNESQFCSMFRKKYGCTPGQYRKST